MIKSTKINRLGLEFVQKCVEILLLTSLENSLLFEYVNDDGDFNIGKELLSNGLSKNDVNRLKCLDDVSSIHVSLSLKLFMQYVQKPLFTEELYNDFIEASYFNYPKMLHEITFLVNHLPPMNYAIVKSLMMLLNKLEFNKEINQFHSPKLAKIFGFHLLFPIELDEIKQTQVLCEIIILNFDRIFNQTDDDLYNPVTKAFEFSDCLLNKVIQCVEIIERNSENEKLYQLALPSWEIENFLNNELNEINVDKSLIASCALKCILKSTIEPVTSYSLYRTLISSNKLSRDASICFKVNNLYAIISSLPPFNYEVLKVLLKHFANISNEKVLSVRKLSLIFGTILMHPPVNKKIRQHDYKDVYEITETLIAKWENICTDKFGIVELEFCQSKPKCRNVYFSESPENSTFTFIETHSIPRQENLISKLSRIKSSSASDTESSDEKEDSTTVKSIKISLSTCKPLKQEESSQILDFESLLYFLVFFYILLVFISYLF